MQHCESLESQDGAVGDSEAACLWISESSRLGLLKIRLDRNPGEANLADTLFKDVQGSTSASLYGGKQR